MPLSGLDMISGHERCGPSACQCPCEPSHLTPLGPCSAQAALKWALGFWEVGVPAAPGILGLNPFHTHLAAGQPPRNTQPGANCYCQSQAPLGLGSQKLRLLSPWLTPSPPSPHTKLVNDGLWDWRRAP